MKYAAERSSASESLLHRAVEDARKRAEVRLCEGEEGMFECVGAGRSGSACNHRVSDFSTLVGFFTIKSHLCTHTLTHTHTHVYRSWQPP